LFADKIAFATLIPLALVVKFTVVVLEKQQKKFKKKFDKKKGG
jgi:hypothetical protein